MQQPRPESWHYKWVHPPIPPHLCTIIRLMASISKIYFKSIYISPSARIIDTVISSLSQLLLLVWVHFNHFQHINHSSETLKTQTQLLLILSQAHILLNKPFRSFLLRKSPSYQVFRAIRHWAQHTSLASFAALSLASQIPGTTKFLRVLVVLLSSKSGKHFPINLQVST